MHTRDVWFLVKDHKNTFESHYRVFFLDKCTFIPKHTFVLILNKRSIKLATEIISLMSKRAPKTSY